MKKIISILILVLVVLGCAEDNKIGLVEYGTVTGKVVKKEGFTPIENAKVTLSPSNNTTFTDKKGNFKFTNVEARSYSVQAIKEGFLNKFQAATVTKNSTVNVVLEMDISTANNRPPTKPVLKSPKDKAEKLDNKVVLKWSSTDKDKDTLTFKIQVRNDFDSNVILIDNIKDSTYTLTKLKFGGKYFWQIGVSDGINEEVLSEVRTFSVKEDPGNRFFYVKKDGGKNVVYSSGYNSDGEVINLFQLTPSIENSWRPRKNNTVNRIAFLRTFNNQTHLYTTDLNGKGEKRITSTVPLAGFNLNEIDYSWSTDGSKLIYPYFDKLYMINNDGTGLRKIYQTSDNSLITECDWSYDGTKIALKTNNSSGYNASIYTIDLNGNIVDTIISNSAGALGGINFSVSGKKILYTRDISDFQSSSYRQLNTHIMVYDFTSATNLDISVNSKKPGTNDLDPRFSPDEAEVIFVNTSNDGVSTRNIFKSTIQPNNLERVLLFKDATMPDWE